MPQGALEVDPMLKSVTLIAAGGVKQVWKKMRTVMHFCTANGARTITHWMRTYVRFAQRLYMVVVLLRTMFGRITVGQTRALTQIAAVILD